MIKNCGKVHLYEMTICYTNMEVRVVTKKKYKDNFTKLDCQAKFKICCIII